MNSDTKFVHYRAVPAEIHMRDDPLPNGARQLTGRLVPYDTPTLVLDQHPDGRREVYQEGFRRGAFDGQVSNGSTNRKVITRIGLIHRHESGLGYLGPFVALREAPDGLWGDANVLPSKADDVAALLRDGVQELSIEFRVRTGENTSITDDGVRWRTCCHLDQVALEPKGAYSSAQVLAFRAEVDDEEREKAEAEAEKAKQDEIAAAEQAKLDEEVASHDAAVARRAAWDEMSARFDGERARQGELVRQYGVTKPGGMGSVNQ